jgi:cohesin loading factor subunit SCC2
MPKTAAKFGQELQLALQPMILKPSSAGGVAVRHLLDSLSHFIHHTVCVQALQETVACMCTVVQNLTHDFVRLVALAKSCNGMIFFVFDQYYFAQSYDILDVARLQQALARPATQKMTPVEARTLSILIFIVSLLSEHCNFDSLRLENDGAQY